MLYLTIPRDGHITKEITEYIDLSTNKVVCEEQWFL